MKKYVFILITLTGHLNAQTTGITEYKDGIELITAMHSKYANGKWYEYLTFSQNMDYYRNDSIVKTDIWHEAGHFPGQLMIKFQSKDSHDAILFSNQHLYFMNKETSEIQNRPMVHDLLLLGMDVYFYKPEYSIHMLDSLGYNLNKIRLDEFNGRKVYVVGADQDDLTSNQFWIDTERLYMHRVINKRGKSISDTRFEDYEWMNNFWVARQVSFLQDGKLSLIEKYFDIKTPKTLNPDYFNPEKFCDVKLD